MRRARILVLDAYDSYANNIVALLEQATSAEVVVCKIDDQDLQSRDVFARFVYGFDAVVAGPGPGSAAHTEDVGLIAQLWTLDPPIPTLGICLGFQSLAYAFGAEIRQLNQPQHGMLAEVHHCRRSIFRGLDDFRAIQYNSLYVDLGRWTDDEQTKCLWKPSSSCPNLCPLAYVHHPQNGRFCVAVRHCSKPFWGVQFHPESICTDAEGFEMISNWWRQVGPPVDVWYNKNHVSASSREAESPPPYSLSPTTKASNISACTVRWKRRSLCNMRTVDICDRLNFLQKSKIVLESATKSSGEPVNPETGRFSIISCTDSDTAKRLEYCVSNRAVTYVESGTPQVKSCSVDEFLPRLESFMDENRATGGSPQIPFWGGLIGFLSYEFGLQKIGVKPVEPNTDRPDACFVFVERSIVIDHVDQYLYVQSIRNGDGDWIHSVLAMIDGSSSRSNDDTSSVVGGDVSSATTDHKPQSLSSSTVPILEKDQPSRVIIGPSEKLYREKVDYCQELIRAGQSYELCLTGQTLLHSRHGEDCISLSENDLYSRLLTVNPAPFAAFMRLSCGEETVSILSSSPERFCHWSRQGTCQFRPIKGTVQKAAGVSFEKAASILNSPKEQAENLMIVDLIRHDLHGVLGHRNVKVRKLMSIEEYETVFQLVSVIEGQLPADGSKTGIDVLAAALPPGSMTGAPKRRSCKLLQEIEAKPRGIYSGVLGYLDVGGGGDFSVVIRTAVKWDAKDGSPEDDIWSIGAGGAVTVQSTSSGEWTEMMAKRSPILRAFTG